MSSITLNLYKNINIYVPGEKIAGTVDCFVNRGKPINAIKVILEGEVKTEWNESESYYDHNKKLQYKNVTYSTKERSLYKELILLQGEVELPAGSHIYTFAFTLPHGGLPSSYNGSYGRIRYRIKAIIERSWNTNLVHKIPLEISAPLDLNDLPYLRNSATTSADKTMWSCFCRDKGILVFNVSLPVTGFIPGQEVHIGAHVQNLTNVNAESVQFKIIQYLEFIARHPSYKAKYIENVICTRTEGGIGAHGEKSWTSILKIPTQKDYPNFDACSIMNVWYRLKAVVVVAGLHANLENEISLVIGGKALTGVSTSFSGDPPPALPIISSSRSGEITGALYAPENAELSEDSTVPGDAQNKY